MLCLHSLTHKYDPFLLFGFPFHRHVPIQIPQPNSFCPVLTLGANDFVTLNFGVPTNHPSPQQVSLQPYE